MKTNVARAIIKDHFRALNQTQMQEYHLTHNDYNRKPLATPYSHQSRTMNLEDEICQKDFDYLNELLYPQPTLSSLLQGLVTVSETTKKPAPQNQHEKPSLALIQHLTDWYDHYFYQGFSGLLKQQSEKLAAHNIEIIKQAYPNQAVMVQNICILSAFWIRSPQTWKATQGDLLSHLFVEYSAPKFLESCWSQVVKPSNLQWLLVYIAYAQGASPKLLSQHFNWRVKSTKLWHHLTQAPPNYSTQDAVLYAEIIRLGGQTATFERLMQNRAYQPELLTSDYEESISFWYSMAEWLIRYQEQFNNTEWQRILIWARHEFTEHHAQGLLFSMYGRSPSKVLSHATDYHRAEIARRAELERIAEERRLAAIARREAQLQQQEEAERLREERRLGIYRWSAYGFGWTYQPPHYVDPNEWRFVELTNSEELAKEGKAMSHCVGGYSYECMEGDSAIVSLRCNQKSVLTIEINPHSGDILQISGYANRDPKQIEQSIVDHWVQKIVRPKYATTTHHKKRRR